MGLFIAGLTARGELVEWLQNLEGSGRFEAVFFRTVSLLGGPVAVRRLPAESRNALNDLVLKSPSDAELYLMRARADEAQLDFTAAETDWQKYAQLTPDKVDGQLQLADFYHRRLRPLDEIKALAAAAQAPSSPPDKLLASNKQRAWQTFERIFQVIRLQALPDTLSIEQYNAWLARYPKEPAVYSRFFDFLVAGGHEVEASGGGRVQGQPGSLTSRLSTPRLFSEAARLIGRYEKRFPQDKVFPVEARATLAYKRGSTDEALALYDRSFQPLWPPELVQDYFNLLKETHRLREFLSRARAAADSQSERRGRSGAPLLLLPATGQSRRGAARAWWIIGCAWRRRTLPGRVNNSGRSPASSMTSTRITTPRAAIMPSTAYRARIRRFRRKLWPESQIFSWPPPNSRWASAATRFLSSATSAAWTPTRAF